MLVKFLKDFNFYNGSYNVLYYCGEIIDYANLAVTMNFDFELIDEMKNTNIIEVIQCD